MNRLEIHIRPMLIQGMLRELHEGHRIIFIDSEQSEEEQNITFLHELLHLFGMRDEAQTEAMAKRLAIACPNALNEAKKVLPWVRKEQQTK